MIALSYTANSTPALTGCVSQLFPEDSHFNDAKYGAKLLELLFLGSIPTFVLGVFSAFILRYWTSITTNRKLLVALARAYAVFCLPVFVFLLWTLVAMFLTFQEAEWTVDPMLQLILPYFVFSVAFIFISLIAFLYFTLDLSYLSDMAERRDSVLGEPIQLIMRDGTHRDLTGLDHSAALWSLCAAPVSFFRRVFSLCGALVSHGVDEVDPHRRASTSALSLLWADFKALFRSTPHRVEPALDAPQEEPRPSGAHKLKALTRRDEADLEHAEGDVERRRLAREQQVAEEAEVLAREREMLENKRRRRSTLDGGAEDALVLSIGRYKALWATLDSAGQFQCKLRAPVAMITFTEHLRQQGFHIVFTSSPSATDSEVGLCNVRADPSDPWFLVRFLVSRNALSAVLKAQDKSRVKQFVKTFALSKILKIDTSDLALL